MTDKATQFEILNRVDVGGMAEIFRAKNLQTGEIMAIKRILPSLVGQAEFVKMFIDEAGVCLTLKHPNIVRVDQIGMMDNALFMSMEFVDGTNLREVLSFANQYQFTLPIHEAVRIAICVLDGLQYAHEHKNANGELLNLIHRDVSPPNILLGYNGDVKITDFGLVKSKSQISKTVPGLIKGKFSYLSPEAAYGESIDLRSDIYAVGIVLWEMLTSRPLFVDPVEMKILDLVRKSIVPSVRQFNAQVSAELEAILMKGLARDRARRYQTAKAFADDLRAFMASIGNPKSDLGAIVAQIKPKHAELAEPQKASSDEAQTAHGKSELVPLDALRREAAGAEGGARDETTAHAEAHDRETQGESCDFPETITAQEHTPHEADSMQTVSNEPKDKDKFRRNSRKFALAVTVAVILFVVLMIALFVI